MTFVATFTVVKPVLVKLIFPVYVPAVVTELAERTERVVAKIVPLTGFTTIGVLDVTHVVPSLEISKLLGAVMDKSPVKLSALNVSVCTAEFLPTTALKSCKVVLTVTLGLMTAVAVYVPLNSKFLIFA